MTRTGRSVSRRRRLRAGLDRDREQQPVGVRDGPFVQQVVRHGRRLRPGVLKLRSFGKPIPISLRQAEAAARAAPPAADWIARLEAVVEKDKLEIRGRRQLGMLPTRDFGLGALRQRSVREACQQRLQTRDRQSEVPLSLGGHGSGEEHVLLCETRLRRLSGGIFVRLRLFDARAVSPVRR